VCTYCEVKKDEGKPNDRTTWAQVATPQHERCSTCEGYESPNYKRRHVGR